MKISMRKSINKELNDKLLLKDASVGKIVLCLTKRAWNAARRFYVGHRAMCNAVLCGVVGLVLGSVL